MTHPHPRPDSSTLEPDPSLKVEYLTRQLAAAADEAASYWATTQQLHREKLALQAELEQVRGELAQARRVPPPPKPSRIDEDLVVPAAEGAT